ncbi:MAG: hypothetical protein Q9208_007735 [Pyrenodesmia sp. 3 TL-2023]
MGDMVAKTKKAYGKQSQDNLALQLRRLRIATPKKDTQVVVRQPLGSIDSNIQQTPLKSKVKKLKAHRKSLVFNTDASIKAIVIDDITKKHLHPLTILPEVGPSVLDFADWSNVWTNHCEFIKIAHGSFGGVFRIQSKAEPGTYTIGKLMALQAKSGFGSKTKEFTSPAAAQNEVLLLSKLDELPGFVQFRKAEIVRGKLPAALVDASVRFDDCQDESDKSNWWIRACDNESQLWLFLEMSDAGFDLDTVLSGKAQLRHGLVNHGHLTVTQVRDIFWQVASALALAEKEFEFEHRDLHLGNICLSPPDAEVQEQSSELYTNKPSIVVTIIDYTLSRASIPSAKDPTYNNLAKDPTLFQATGTQWWRQYQVYRDMKTAVKNQWRSYSPITNVLWLQHLLVELLEKQSRSGHRQEEAALESSLRALKQWMMNNCDETRHAQDVVLYCERNSSNAETVSPISASTSL